VERLLQAGSNCGIIVYRNNITAIAKKLLQAGAIPGVKLEVFKVSKTKRSVFSRLINQLRLCFAFPPSSSFCLFRGTHPFLFPSCF